MKTLKFTLLISVIFFSGCSLFSVPGPTTTPVTVPWACNYSGMSDVSLDLAQLKKEYIDRNNNLAGERFLKKIMSAMSCSNPAVYRVMFSYAINDPLPGQQLKENYCISVSILEDEERNPHFEEWAACNTSPTDINYFIDFNNITTDNRPINQNLRMRHVFPIGNRIERLLSQRLMADFIIHDNDEFLFEAIGFDVGISESVMEHFYVISAF